MIILENKNDKVTLQDDINSNISYIKLKKVVKIDPYKLLEYSTGVFATCTNNWDELCIDAGVSDETFKVAIISDFVNDEDGTAEIKLVIYNPSDTILKLPAKTTIAKLHKVIKNDGSHNVNDVFKTQVFRDGEIAVYSLKNKIINFSIDPTSEMNAIQISYEKEKEE